MHCWDCGKVIVVVSPHAAIGGTLPPSVTVAVSCSSCRATYNVTTTSTGHLPPNRVDTRSDWEKEKDRMWKE